jgi:uncharacterized protein YbjT (DUF2867 family)
MKVIITGATGMVGKGVLLECLDHQDVEEVLCIGRRPLDKIHSKLKELVVADFSDLEPIADQLNGYDACFFCLGISAMGLTEAQYTKITYDYTLNLARLLYGINPQMTFNYVSGAGTDSSEKGRSMWARVKGKTENDVIGLGFEQAFMFRPGIIIPLKGIKSRTRAYQFFYDYFMWLIKIIRFLSPNSICTTTQLGLAMINSVKKGYSKQHLDPKDIIILSLK